MQNIIGYEGIARYLFVSYAHKDSDQVYPVLKFLFDEGYRIWFDKNIELGSVWNEELQNHIDNAYIFLFFASKESVKSVFCLEEIQRAIKKEKRIIIVYLEECFIEKISDRNFTLEQGVYLYEED